MVCVELGIGVLCWYRGWVETVVQVLDSFLGFALRLPCLMMVFVVMALGFA